MLFILLCIEGFAWISFVFLQPKHAGFNKQSSRRVRKEKNMSRLSFKRKKRHLSLGKAWLRLQLSCVYFYILHMFSRVWNLAEPRCALALGLWIALQLAPHFFFFDPFFVRRWGAEWEGRIIGRVISDRI